MLAGSDCAPFTISTAEMTYGNVTNGSDATFMLTLQRPSEFTVVWTCFVSPSNRGCAFTRRIAPGCAVPATVNVLPTVWPFAGDAMRGRATLAGGAWAEVATRTA